MTFDDIRYLLKIAEFQSISKAAQALFITQPTLSQRLTKIETELGTRLFNRTRFGELSLTDAGRICCNEGLAIMAHWERMQTDLKALHGQRAVTMGIPIRSGYRFVSRLLETLQIEYPNIQLTFVDRSNYAMEDMIQRNELDFALIRMPSLISPVQSRLIFNAYPSVYLRKGSPLVEKIYYHPNDPTPYIDFRLLANEPLVVLPSVKEHRTQVWLEALLEKIPQSPSQTRYTVPNVSLFTQFAENGTASFVIPSRDLRENGCRVEEEFNLPYPLYFVQSERADPEIADTIFSILCQQNQ